MLFSLIVATIGKSTEITTLLDSLSLQTYKEFELIFIDQNQDDRILDQLEPYCAYLPVKYIRSSQLGLSKARNLGLSKINGNIVAFPDDDCWYPCDILRRLKDLFDENPDLDGIAGRVVDETDNNIARFASRSGSIKKYGVWERSSSVSIFLRRELVKEVGKFDETLGVGAGTSWGGGEDIDYPIRAIKAGFNLYYDPDIYVYHPRFPLDDADEVFKRAHSYGAGIGRVLRKHNLPTWLVGYYFLRPLGGTLWGIVRSDRILARYHWNSLLGRWRGWRSRT